MTAILCASINGVLINVADGQVWNRSSSRTLGTGQPAKDASKTNSAQSVSPSPSIAEQAAVTRQSKELPEPKLEMPLPKIAPQQRFELNQEAFAQPRSSSGGSGNIPQRPQTGRSLSSVSSGNSSRPLPRLANRQTSGATLAVRSTNRTSGTGLPASGAVAKSPTASPSTPGSEAVYTADEEAPGHVVAPMPQRTNTDGSRSPVASFGEWDVRRDDANHRSMRTATLTDDQTRREQSPAFHVPMQNESPHAQSSVHPQDAPPLTIPEAPTLQENTAPPISQEPTSLPPASQPYTPDGSAPDGFTREAYDLQCVEHGHSPHLPMTSGSVIQHHALYWWEKELAGSMLKDRSPMPMSLAEALQLALNEAPELKILHADWYIQMQEQIRQDAAFDWTTFVDSVWNRDSAPVGSQLDGAAQRLRSRTASASAGLRRLDRHGGNFEISQQLGLRESNSQFILPNNQGNSRLSLRYERPLLRSAGEDYTTGPLKLSELDKDIAFDRMQSGIQDHLLEVARAYWALVLTRGDFLQKITSWNRARAIAEEMESRADIDVTSGTLDRARAEVSSRLASSIQSEHDVQSAQEVLLELIYASRYTIYTRNEVITTTLPPHQPTTVDVESQAEIAVQARSEVHQAIREIRAASIEYQLSQVDMKPRLDLVLSGYSAGLNPNFDVGNSVVNQFNQGEPGAGFGFEYELPYKNRAAKAAAEQRRIAVTRLQREFEDVVGEVKQDVRSQAIRRNKFASTLPQQAESLALARRLMDYTQTRRDFLADGVQVGDLYLTDLLQIQSRVQSAEFQYLQAQVSFAVADNAFLRSLSSLQTLADQGTLVTGETEVPLPATQGPSSTEPFEGSPSEPALLQPAPVEPAPVEPARIGLPAAANVPTASRGFRPTLWLSRTANATTPAPQYTTIQPTSSTIAKKPPSTTPRPGNSGPR
jgi:hypothetical protein